jgi:hypothetical protein
MPLLACLCRDLFERARIDALAGALGLSSVTWADDLAIQPPEAGSWLVADLLEPGAIEVALRARDAGWQVLAYGPHVRADLFADARAAGLEACARSALDRILAARAC